MKTSKNKNVTNLNPTSWLNDFYGFKKSIDLYEEIVYG